mgnify:CR=1 FL=1
MCLGVGWWACLGDEGLALSLGGLHPVNVARMSFGPKAAHDPIGILKSLWARWKSLESILTHPKPPQNTP